jgi:hypothetical protein
MQQENAKSWDKLLAPLLGLGGILMLLVVGLDERFYWSPAFSLPLKIVALVFLIAGYAVGSFALIENRLFSGVMRIQADRNQHVVSSGSYH